MPEPIKITKWMIFRRRLIDGMRLRVARLQTWWKQVTETRRALKSPQVLTLLKRGLSDSGQPETRNNPVIQIGVGNRPAADSAGTRPLTNAPQNPRGRAQANRKRNIPGRRIINVEPTAQICLACTDELSNEPAARCRTNGDHVIHARCVSLVRGICPVCRGRITSAQRL